MVKLEFFFSWYLNNINDNQNIKYNILNNIVYFHYSFNYLYIKIYDHPLVCITVST